MADNTMVVKMTVNSKEFDNGLQNAKASMNTFDSKIKTVSSSFKESLGGVTMAFGAVSAAIGVAKTAMDTYQKVMRSTEQGADKLDRAMNQVTVVTNKFFQSLANGSFTSFLDGLSDIAKNAREAYDALDNLGTLKMWSGSRINELKASIAEDRVIVNSASTTAEEKSAAQARISVNMDKIKALSGDIADATITALDAKLREMSGAAKEVTNDMLKSYVEMFQNGTLYDESVKFMREHSTQVTSTFTVGNQEGMPAYQQQVTTQKWDSEQNRKIYEAMHTLATITEGEGGWQDYYKLIDELSAQRLNIANQENRANTAVDKNTSGTSGKGGSTQKVIVEIEPKMDVNQYARYVMGNKTLDTIPYTELELPEEDIVEPETDQLLARRNEQLAEEQKRMDALAESTRMGITAMNAFGSALGYVGSMSGDSTFGKITSSLGQVVSQAAATTSAMMSLAGAETIEGLAETFAEAPTMTKVALTATALAGILSMIASVKSTFAGSFAEGGTVGGTSYTGDKLIARVNSGERILTSRQWDDLLKSLAMMEAYREEVSNTVNEQIDNTRSIETSVSKVSQSNNTDRSSDVEFVKNTSIAKTISAMMEAYREEVSNTVNEQIDNTRSIETSVSKVSQSNNTDRSSDVEFVKNTSIAKTISAMNSVINAGYKSVLERMSDSEGEGAKAPRVFSGVMASRPVFKGLHLPIPSTGGYRINSTVFGGAETKESSVRFVIEGDQLRGVLDNYDKISNL